MSHCKKINKAKWNKQTNKTATTPALTTTTYNSSSRRDCMIYGTDDMLFFSFFFSSSYFFTSSLYNIVHNYTWCVTPGQLRRLHREDEYTHHRSLTRLYKLSVHHSCFYPHLALPAPKLSDKGSNSKWPRRSSHDTQELTWCFTPSQLVRL